MPPFRFRFESLLSLHHRRRVEIGGEVGKATEAIRRVDQQIEFLQQQRNEIRDQTAAKFAGSSPSGTRSVSADSMLQAGRYDLQLAGEINSLANTRQTLEVELDRRRGLLVEAEVEVKRLERLRETQARAHRHSTLRFEQAEADDLTTSRMVIADRRIGKQKEGSQS